nr:MAG TPA: hypothetical protein [Bacteriophage sp.]
MKRLFISVLSMILIFLSTEILYFVLLYYRNSVSLQRVQKRTSGQRYEKGSRVTNFKN